ncbi:MAG: PadR family transcriptional regulator [Capsulimonadaceae bacterium]
MDAERELKKGSTPALILAVLSDGPRHGYSIAREIERRSADALSMGEGTLYPTLKGLETDGFVTSEWQNEAPGPSRKVYKLTDKGRGELDRHKSLWQTFSTAVSSVLGGTPDVKPA